MDRRYLDEMLVRDPTLASWELGLAAALRKPPPAPRSRARDDTRLGGLMLRVAPGPRPSGERADPPRALPPTAEVLPSVFSANAIKPPLEIMDSLERLVGPIDSKHRLRTQLARIRRSPDDVELCIGTAKEILETTIVSIYERITGQDLDPSLTLRAKMSKLVGVVEVIRNPSGRRARYDAIVNIAHATAKMVHQIAEMRNTRGTGHGHHIDVPMEDVHHASYVVSQALNTSLWLWEMHLSA